MATGVRPRDEDIHFTRSDLEAIQDAMKSKKFRELLNDYCEEIRDPANQAIYQKEMTQLEKERGYDVTFINPKGGYVIKTSVAGDRKAFINICSNENVKKPSCSPQELNGQMGMNWRIPYSLIPPRNDYDQRRQMCVIYDVVFHPNTLRMAEVNKRFRELVNKTALDGLLKTYNIHLDTNNCRFPKSEYKGMTIPAVIRKEDPDYKPEEEENEELSPEIIEKLYPQRTYPNKREQAKETKVASQQQKRKPRRDRAQFSHLSDKGYTIPKYDIKQQKAVDLQDFTFHKNSKQYSAIPSHIVVEIHLPLLSSTQDCILDVKEKSLNLTSEKQAKYKLSISLPYCVNDECGSAKFDKSKRKLIVTLPVIKMNAADGKCSKVDSGVESEETLGSQSEEETCKEKLVEELSSTPVEAQTLHLAQMQISRKANEETFLEPSLGFVLPPYTHNVLDDIIAFTFHVKNTEPDSVKVKKEDNKIFIKFTSIGSGFVPVHYAAILMFDDCFNFGDVTGEAWDNNVILQMELAGDVPQKFEIGLNNDSMTSEFFNVSHSKKSSKAENEDISEQIQEESQAPVVEVTNSGTETNIVVSSNNSEYDEDDLFYETATSTQKEVRWINPSGCGSAAKSILRKPMSMMRSFSESSAGDVASSMDYISSDCIPEESSLKKTVRFSNVIARQFYRYNSSIEAQKKKNQRKKGKKRSQERRKSESEAEDDVANLSKNAKPRLKSVLKQRRDSGLADTSDAESECKSTPSDYDSMNDDYQSNRRDSATDGYQSSENEQASAATSVLNIVDGKTIKDSSAIWESKSLISSDCLSGNNQKKVAISESVTCDSIKHKSDFYDPEKLNKGQYLEVTFKNDLIFDLDM